MHKWSVHYLEGYNSDWFLENHPNHDGYRAASIGYNLEAIIQKACKAGDHKFLAAWNLHFKL